MSGLESDKKDDIEFDAHPENDLRMTKKHHKKVINAAAVLFAITCLEQLLSLAPLTNLLLLVSGNRVPII